MKLPLNWLSDYTDISGISNRQYQDALTMSGSKVEGIEYLGEEINNVITAKIVKIEKHPDADKLSVCQVSKENGEDPIQIVTGAKNIAEGDIVPVALHKSTLPNGVTIKSGNLRGVKSNGMMCSHVELDIPLGLVPYGDENGILIMPTDTPVGVDIKTALGLDTHVVEFEITSNRPDCMSAIGIARETAATFSRPFNFTEPSNTETSEGEISDFISVKIENTDLCPRYIAKVVKDIKIEPSPAWLRERLYACGVRPINNIVDITNYVMLEYGQPMHAFDYACLSEKQIVVRTANDDKTVTTLDDQERALSPEMLIIADGTRPVAVAGVMGGANSEITDDTKVVVFESANFDGASVRLTAKKIGMRTDASARFEKGLDPKNTMPAVLRACQLIEELGAGTVVSGIIDVDYSPAENFTMELEADKINALLGTKIPVEDMETYLKSLGFEVNGTTLVVPSFRQDVRTTPDVAEEVARIFGYDKIPTTLYAGETVQGAFTPSQKFENDASSLMRGLGYDEIVTHSFVSPKVYDKIALADNCPRRLSTTITNPLGEDFSVMRTTSMPSMLEALSKNFNFRNANVNLFELAMIYLPSVKDGAVVAEIQPEEKKILTLGSYGKTDFFEFKGAIEALFENLSIYNVSFEGVSNNPSYHPGRCAQILSGDTVIGTMGTVHPAVCKNFELGTDVLVAELDMNVMLSLTASDKLYKHLPKFPASTRDIAIICDANTPVAHLEKCIKDSVGDMLEEINLFDVYRGNQIAEDKKSVAYSIVLRVADRTLTVEECDKAVARALDSLKSKFNATLRA